MSNPALAHPHVEPHGVKTWLLSCDPARQLILQRMLMADLLCLSIDLLRAVGAYLGLISMDRLLIQVFFDVTGLSIFYLMVRLGHTRHFKDPAITLPQILFGLSSVVISYGLIEVGRGAALQMLCVLLVYGMYRLAPRQIMIAGGLTVAMLVGMVIAMSGMAIPGFDLQEEIMNMALSAVLLPVLAFIAKRVSEMRAKQMAQSVELSATVDRLKELATKDALTGLTNRRHMLTLMEDECKRLDRTGKVFCIAILDIDHFKHINDGHGHPMGDAVLKQLASLAFGTLRASDVFARWGGEEFLILMPDSDLKGAEQILVRLRDHLGQHWGFEVKGQWHPVTLSAGVTQYRQGEDLSLTLERADRALYAAKTHGRDQARSA